MRNTPRNSAVVMSRKKMISFRKGFPSACNRMNLISISSTDQEYSDEVVLDGWATVPLVLKFDDITGDSDEQELLADKFTFFNEDMAHDAIHFIDAVRKSDHKNIVNHCDAGVSRSAAFGRFLEDIHNYDVKYNDTVDSRYANILVYCMLRKIWLRINNLGYD